MLVLTCRFRAIRRQTGLAWPEQQRLLTLTDRMLRTGIPPELEVDV